VKPPQQSEAHIREQSQWSLVLREFRKRKLAVVSWWVILLLVTVSIFAPFVANNKPLYYHGINRFDYRESLRTILTLALKISRLPESPSGDELQNARREAGVIEDMSGTIASMLVGQPREAFEQDAERLVSLADRAITDPAVRPDLASLRVEMRRNYRALDEQLVSRTFWPVIRSLGWADIGFMTLNLLLLLFPVWKRIVYRIDPSGRRRLVPLAFVLLPVVFSLVWWMTVPPRVDRTPYREGVRTASEQSGDAPVVYDSVVWPLVPYALDESDLNQKYEPEAGLSALFAPLATPELADEAEVLPWSRPHVIGTDDTGRDLFARMIWGGRVSLSVGIVAVSIYITIGIIVGAIAGYFRGGVDMIVSRIIEIVICFPSFFLILAIVAFLGPSIFNIMLVIGLTSWTGIARLVRGEFLRLSNQEFVLAGRALGYSPWRIIFKHILPNAMAPVLVSATFGVAGAILTESALSFLGLGISVPTPSWGGILATGRQSIHFAQWIIFYPGMAIFITITSYNLVGEALRDAADPRLRGKH
jgi:peptide/nickel transport system permease protein